MFHSFVVCCGLLKGPLNGGVIPWFYARVNVDVFVKKRYGAGYEIGFCDVGRA